MIEVELSKIIIDEQKKEQVIVLKEKKGNRLLPIIIGIREVTAIKMKLDSIALALRSKSPIFVDEEVLEKLS